MSNSFNISVKPEIAAAVVKIDAIKNDTGPIRNDVTAIHDTNLPAVKSDTGPIRNDVTAIHDTMLPAVKVDTGAIRNDVTDIHDTNLPAVKTDTGAIRNDMNDIKYIDLPAVKIVVDSNDTKLDTIIAAPTFSAYPSDDLLSSADTERANTDGQTYAKVKEIFIGVPGTFRITFDIKRSFSSTAYGKIYKNGVSHGTEQSTTSSTYVTKTEDLLFSAGDLIQLYTKCSTADAYSIIENFRIKGVYSGNKAVVITD